MTEQANQLRHKAGIYLDKEAALAAGLPAWRVRRAVTLGVISYNTIGTGQMVVNESDLWKLTSEAGIPAVKGNWFDESRSFDPRFFGHFVERGSGDPFGSFKAEFLSTGLSVGEAMLVHSAQGFAKYQLRNQNVKYGFRGQPNDLAGFYSMGPDKFRHFEADVKDRLHGVEFRLHGKSFHLGTLCKYGFDSLVKQSIRRAF